MHAGPLLRLMHSCTLYIVTPTQRQLYSARSHPCTGTRPRSCSKFQGSADVCWQRLHQLAALQALVRFFRVSLARLCKGAEDMRDLASPHWAPRVAAYINSAHFLQQALQVLLCHHCADPTFWLQYSGSAGTSETSVHTAHFCSRPCRRHLCGTTSCYLHCPCVMAAACCVCCPVRGLRRQRPQAIHLSSKAATTVPACCTTDCSATVPASETCALAGRPVRCRLVQRIAAAQVLSELRC